MIELMSLKELMFIKPVNHIKVYYLHFYFLKLNFRFQSKACNGCHDLMQKAEFQ